jgi:hypothetical protein
VVNNTKGKQEDSGRDRSEHDQAQINRAMEPLARTTVLAFCEVGFIVAAHFQRDPRNVVSPSRQNLSNHRINARHMESLNHSEIETLNNRDGMRVQ